MTSKLRIDLSRKAEPVRFSFPLLLNQLTVMHSYLSFGQKTPKLKVGSLNLVRQISPNCPLCV